MTKHLLHDNASQLKARIQAPIDDVVALRRMQRDLQHMPTGTRHRAFMEAHLAAAARRVLGIDLVKPGDGSDPIAPREPREPPYTHW